MAAAFSPTNSPEDPKIIPSHRTGRRLLLTDAEARALADCSPHRNIALFFRHFTTAIAIHGQTVPVHALLFELIEEANTFKEFLAAPDLSLSRKDVSDILTGLASGLFRMHSRNLWHDDLHDENVLIRRIGPDENLSERYEAKLIDFGSAIPLRSDEQEHGARGDYHYLARHIYDITERFERGARQVLSPVDRAFAGRLRTLAQRIDDPDVSRRSLTPSDLIVEIRRAYDESAKSTDFPTFAEMQQQSTVSLTEPLENTNALSLAPQDIGLLFRDSLKWRARLEKTEPVIVVGPRGCGKTMLLRYLSLETRGRPQRDEVSPEQVRTRLEQQPFVGFLVSVGQLRTPFFRSSYKRLQEGDASRAEELCREFVTGFFLMKVIRTVAWLHAERLAAILEPDIGILCSAVRDLIGSDPAAHAGSLVTIGRLEDAVEVVERRLRALSNLADPAAYTPAPLARDDALEVVARALKVSSWVSGRQIWFLLDDYSVTMVPPFVQRSYNPVLFKLPATYRVKLSSEGDGPVLEDHFKRKYKEGRELSKVNLGEVYFSATDRQGKVFFEQILEARFAAVGKGSLAEVRALLGEHKYEKNFGQYICRQKRAGDVRFYGFGLLCELCSGDVSFIIELLHSLTQGQWGQVATCLPIAQQDEIVKRFAQRQLADLKRISEHGSAIYEFAERLGGLLRHYLLSSRGKKDPDERLRIEGLRRFVWVIFDEFGQPGGPVAWW